MPSKSPAQARLMQAVAHNPQFAKKVGIPQSVGREFAQADRGKVMNKHEAAESPAYEKAEESLMKKHHPAMYKAQHEKPSHSGHDHGHKHLSHKMMPGEHRKEERLKHYNEGFHAAKKERHEAHKHHLNLGHRGK